MSKVVEVNSSNFDQEVAKYQGVVMADFSDFDFADDEAFCTWLTREIKVAAIPPSYFYSQPHRHLARTIARFAFCKTDESLARAAERLQMIGNI